MDDKTRHFVNALHVDLHVLFLLSMSSLATLMFNCYNCTLPRPKHTQESSKHIYLSL